MAERGGPARLRDLLGEVGARFGLNDAVAAGGLWSKWSEIVGPRIAEHAQPSSLRQGVLRVRVSSPTWATELSYFAPEIIRRANEMTGTDVVREVKVWSAPGDIQRPAPTTGRPSEPSPDDASRGTRSDDPREAFDAAREAWKERVSKGRREHR